ncbi:pyocin knob domain-containing protein, partial [Desulfovibrio sp. OttesenSCG-928-A18]|nr:pyocin knob domain-containing protein [Desulfovibrio sp. OttesenSCG-928-A18]
AVSVGTVDCNTLVYSGLYQISKANLADHNWPVGAGGFLRVYRSGTSTGVRQIAYQWSGEGAVATRYGDFYTGVWGDWAYLSMSEKPGKVWTSGEIAIAAGVINANHNLALAAPQNVRAEAWLRCKTATYGYQVGDELRSWGNDTASGSGQSPVPPIVTLSANSVSVRIGSNNTGIILLNENGQSGGPAAANFRLIFKIFY